MTATAAQDGPQPLRVLICFGVLQPMFDLEWDEAMPLLETIAGAFDDLAGRFGVTVIGTMDDDVVQCGPALTYPWTAYVLADAPDLDAVKKVCAVPLETNHGKHVLQRYLRIETRIGRPLFFATA